MEIRQFRKRTGFTQVQLSEATGIDQASISRIENGKQGVSLDYLQRMARAMGVSVADLIGDAIRH